MTTSATLQPRPSTTEFVARVVDRLTTSVFLRRSRSKPSIAPLMPRDRSSCVVIDLDLASILPLSMSSSTASVNVPPVSSPSPILVMRNPP